MSYIEEKNKVYRQSLRYDIEKKKKRAWEVPRVFGWLVGWLGGGREGGGRGAGGYFFVFQIINKYGIDQLR